MDVNSNVVLLLKSAKSDEADPYVQILNKNGFAAYCVPVLSFEFVNMKQLEDALRKPDSYGGIVLTSPRAVEATSKAMEAVPIGVWRLKPIFVVGKATAAPAQRLGFSVKGEESGNAENLVKLILTEITAGGPPLLFPCGNLRKETIPQALDTAGVKLDSITVYETTADPKLEQNLHRLIAEKGVPKYLVFYSPSGVQFLKQSLIDMTLPLTEIKLIAIGPSTREEIIKQGFKVSSEAEKPTAESVLQAISVVKEKEDTN